MRVRCPEIVPQCLVLAVACLCIRVTAAVPIGSQAAGWWTGDGPADEGALAGIHADDPYLRALGTFFRRLAASKAFYNEVWEQQPRHWTSAEAAIPRPAFGVSNITSAAASGMLGNSGDTYFTEQQGGKLCAATRDAAGRLRRAGHFKINTTLALSGVPMTPDVVQQHFDAGETLSINKAGYVWSWVADICRTAIGALGLYANVNLYATREGAQVAIPAHNDRQDVFILQLQGHKRWVLYRPVDPLPTYEQERGKDHNGAMPMEELTDAHKTHDLVLAPGDVLYVPRGYVHETSTAVGSPPRGRAKAHGDSHSVALTLGLETATLSQTFENALTCLAAKAQWAPHVGLSEATAAVSAVRAATAKVVALRRALPFGFLSAYTSRKETTALMRSLVKSAVEEEFPNFEERLRIRKSEYAKVLDYFVSASHKHLGESLSIYAGIATQDPADATSRQRRADARFVQHSRDLLKPCGITLDG